MKSPATPDITSAGVDTFAGGGEAVASLAMLGKTTAALAVVIALILLCSYLLKRLNRVGGMSGQHLQVVCSVAVGQKERVVIVAVDKTWLVLGVASGQVSKLHELDPPPAAAVTAGADPGRFASRFVQALAHRNQSGPGAGGSGQ